MVNNTVLVEEEVAIEVTVFPDRAPSPPAAILHDSKLNGLKIAGSVQSAADMAPGAADMLPRGQALTALGSFSSFMRIGQKYPIGQGVQLEPCILVPGRQINAAPALGKATHWAASLAPQTALKPIPVDEGTKV